MNEGEFIVAFNAKSEIIEVILDVFEAIDVGKVAMVVELTPPTLFTVGRSAVPPKSLVNLSLPLVVELASAIDAPPTKVLTKAVVAI